MKNGEFVSEVKADLQALNKDQHVSASYILQKGRGYVEYLLGQRATSDIFRDDSIFKELRCFEMSKVRKHKCDIVEFRNCDNVMKSKLKLPNLYNSRIGTIVVSVTNIDGSIEYTRLRQLSDYKSQQKRKFGQHFKYYYISDGYLYLVNSTEVIVNIVALFSDESELDKKSKCATEDPCKTILDYEFICPEKYISQVKDQTVQNLLNGHKRVPIDENPNLNATQ